MFEHYTEKARRVIFHARYAASEFGSASIETEHLLVGLVREAKPTVNLYLDSETNEESIRTQIESQTATRRKIPTSVDIPLSDECMRALAFAAEEAERMRQDVIGAEHLFLGLLREESCIAAKMLRERGAEIETIRKKLSESPPSG
jgi:ATP-dependent Clp protease ATP-binding subunit ClpC